MTFARRPSPAGDGNAILERESAERDPWTVARRVLGHLLVNPWLSSDLDNLTEAGVLDMACMDRFGPVASWDPDLRMWTLAPGADGDAVRRAAEGIGDAIAVYRVMEE